jgi:hypothetical protein
MVDSVPYNFRQEQEKIARRKQLAEALQMQAMAGAPGGQMVSGHYVGPSLLQSLAPLAQALVGQKLQKDVDTQSTDLGQRYNQAMASSLETYLKERQANPEEAARRAMTSEFAPLQKIAAEDMDRLVKGMVTSKDILGAGDFSQDSRLEAIRSGGNLQLLKPKDDTRVINGQLYRRGPDGQYSVLVDARDRYGDVGQLSTGPDGRPVMGQVNLATNKASFTPGGINIDTTTKAGTALTTALAGETAKILTDARDKTSSAIKSYSGIEEAERALDAGIKTGSLADVSLQLNKVAKAFGVPEAKPEIANTELYKTSLMKQVASIIKDFNTGQVSDADREFAIQMSGADITYDPETLQRLLQIAKAAQLNSMLDYKTLLSNVGQTPNVVPEQLKAFSLPVGALDRVSTKPTPGKVYFDRATGRFTVAPKEGTASVVPSVNVQGIQQTPTRKVYNYNEM